MSDCKAALEEVGWDLQKAVDVIKVKGLNIADGRSGRAAAEGKVGMLVDPNTGIGYMMEINCQTDFVANSEGFKSFASHAMMSLYSSIEEGGTFTADDVESARKEVVASTKENVVVRRWWVEQPLSSNVRVVGYQHPNAKIGVLVTVQAPSEETANTTEFQSLCDDLAMQIAAMSPLAVSPDRLSPEDTDRQLTIFQTQLKEANKPEKMWPKIVEGKLRKWEAEVCLLEQESIVIPKTSVGQIVKNVGTKLGGEIAVVNFVRCQVGKGIETKKDDFVSEVEKLSGVSQQGTPCRDQGN
jgi:elongation factor Ts